MSHHNSPLSPTNSITPANPFSTKIKLLILLMLWALAFLPVYPSLILTWLKHSNNSHGILVPLITAFLIWKKRDLLSRTIVSTSNWGALILIGSLGLYIISYAGALAFLARAMVVFSLVGLILFTLGKSIFLITKFPLLYLLFMVPVPDSIYNLIALPLQLFATKISAFIIQILTIPAYREGNMIYFAQTQLEIAEACSGLRSMMSFIMLGVLFAYMMDEKPYWKKTMIIFSTIPLSLFANIFRVTATGILAHFYGNQVARGFLHEFSGLAVFAFGFILLFFEYAILNKESRK
jgi:exosortase